MRIGRPTLLSVLIRADSYHSWTFPSGSFRVATLLLLSILAACAPQPPADSGSTCPILLRQSRAAGVDYVPTLRKAAAGDEAAIKSLFELTGSPAFTAEAEQCHIEALAELLNRLGDRQFSVALSAETPDVRRAVVSGLVIELDNFPTAERSRAAFANQYPHTAATAEP